MPFALGIGGFSGYRLLKAPKFISHTEPESTPNDHPPTASTSFPGDSGQLTPPLTDGRGIEELSREDDSKQLPPSPSRLEKDPPSPHARQNISTNVPSMNDSGQSLKAPKIQQEIPTSQLPAVGRNFQDEAVYISPSGEERQAKVDQRIGACVDEEGRKLEFNQKLYELQKEEARGIGKKRPSYATKPLEERPMVTLVAMDYNFLNPDTNSHEAAYFNSSTRLFYDRHGIQLPAGPDVKFLHTKAEEARQQLTDKQVRDFSTMTMPKTDLASCSVEELKEIAQREGQWRAINESRINIERMESEVQEAKDNLNASKAVGKAQVAAADQARVLRATEGSEKRMAKLAQVTAETIAARAERRAKSLQANIEALQNQSNSNQMNLGTDECPLGTPDPDGKSAASFYVQIQTGERITIRSYLKTTTVEALKKALEIRTGTPADKMLLACAGKKLENHRTLAYYELAEKYNMAHMRSL
jgi:hypothetical protein